MANRTTSSIRGATSLAALTATAALALAACAGDGADTGRNPSASAAERQEAALRFARCMREQGIDMPNPSAGPGGLVRIEPSVGTEPDDPRAQRARRACARHLPRLDPQGVPEEERREAQQAALRFARCMREQGVDMPDPGPQGQVLFGPESGLDPTDPRFQRAERACREALPVPGGAER